MIRMKKLTKYELDILNRIKDLDKNNPNNGDYECEHLKSDGLLIELLRKLGYDEICDAYENVGKWYA